jgi:hypothetical protein
MTNNGRRSSQISIKDPVFFFHFFLSVSTPGIFPGVFAIGIVTPRLGNGDCVPAREVFTIAPSQKVM